MSTTTRSPPPTRPGFLSHSIIRTITVTGTHISSGGSTGLFTWYALTNEAAMGPPVRAVLPDWFYSGSGFAPPMAPASHQNDNNKPPSLPAKDIHAGLARDNAGNRP